MFGLTVEDDAVYLTTLAIIQDSTMRASQGVEFDIDAAPAIEYLLKVSKPGMFEDWGYKFWFKFVRKGKARADPNL